MCVLTTSALLRARPPSHPADANNKGERRGAEWAVVTGARSTVVGAAAASSSAPSPRCSSRSAPSSPGGAPRATVGPQNPVASSSSSAPSTSSSTSGPGRPAHIATVLMLQNDQTCSRAVLEDKVVNLSCLRTDCRGRARSCHVKKRPPPS